MVMKERRKQLPRTTGLHTVQSATRGTASIKKDVLAILRVFDGVNKIL